MTAYKNYVYDLPTRCVQLLDEFNATAQERGWEVTLLLGLATPCVLLPYERLHRDAHPSKDQERFAEARRALNEELERSCGASQLWDADADQAWRFMVLPALDGDPDAWGMDDGAKPIGHKKSRTVLKILRNALAHGNIWTRGDPIAVLVFVSLAAMDKPEGPFNVIQCSPVAFEEFLRRWIRLLARLNIPSDVFVETRAFAEEAA